MKMFEIVPTKVIEAQRITRLCSNCVWIVFLGIFFVPENNHAFIPYLIFLQVIAFGVGMYFHFKLPKRYR